eukprot:Phypoly_transcript_22166.p1 GENE.Phypoly_transcript_22166~~Phypoly_transcript_22166.p1  ORF type:complete len:111 (+),score=15.39 Phypoly_transcript_22166:281-613(+)
MLVINNHMPGTNLEYIVPPEALNQFEEEGYLVLENIFTDELQVCTFCFNSLYSFSLQIKSVLLFVVGVIDAITKTLDHLVKAAAEGKISGDFAEYDFVHRLVKINDENKK